MAITLTYGTQVLDLPQSLIWSDELSWTRVTQKVEYSIEGALVVDRFVMQAGRPITLTGTASRAWIERGTLRTLQAWASLETEAVLTLRLQGRDYRVIFDLAAQGGAVRGQPVFAWNELVDGDDYCSVELRFLEV